MANNLRTRIGQIEIFVSPQVAVGLSRAEEAAFGLSPPKKEPTAQSNELPLISFLRRLRLRLSPLPLSSGAEEPHWTTRGAGRKKGDTAPEAARGGGERKEPPEAAARRRKDPPSSGPDFGTRTTQSR